MTLRAALILLAFLITPAAFAQREPIASITAHEACDSRGASEDPSDIDAATCRSYGYLAEVDSQRRIVWVRGTVAVKETYTGAAPLAVYTGALAARDIWWNGERIGRVGQPGASPETEIIGNLDAVTWIPPHLIRKGGNEIAIRYSTQHLPLTIATPLHYAYVAPMGVIERLLFIDYAPGLAATGALVAAAIFFGFAFVTNRKVIAPLFISMMALFAVGQLWLESLRAFVNYPYPDQIWRLSAIAFLAMAFALSMTAYVAHRFARKRWRLHVAIAAALAFALGAILPGFDGMTLGFIMGPSIVSLVAALQGVLAKRSGAIVTSLALAVFLALQLIENAGFLNRTFYLAVSLLALVLFIDQVRELSRARAAAEEASRKAALLELELLRRRIAPHFLMNTLNALTEWVESDPKTGVKMIEALAGEFRLLSQVSDRPLIPLADEIALCRRHLEVMSYRVGRAFTLRAENVDESIEIPPGVLHTLVENAFTHGRFSGGEEFVLTQKRDADTDRLTLLSPPAEPAPPPKTSSGQGLAYVRGRIEAAFGAGAQLAGGPTPKGWLSELVLPRRPRPA